MANWQNRIVGYSEEPPDQLLASPDNWRVHPKGQQDALAGVLHEVGLVQNIVANRRSGRVVDGHLRVSLALREQQPTVPVTWVDLDEAEEALILATLDPLAAMAATDAEKLDALLREVSTGDAAVQELLADLAEASGVVPPDFDPNAEWAGMPEFQQEDQMPSRQIIVNFATAEAVAAFARLVDQDMTEKTKSIWYPKVERRDQHGLGYLSDEP